MPVPTPEQQAAIVRFAQHARVVNDVLHDAADHLMVFNHAGALNRLRLLRTEIPQLTEAIRNLELNFPDHHG